MSTACVRGNENSAPAPDRRDSDAYSRADKPDVTFGPTIPRRGISGGEDVGIPVFEVEKLSVLYLNPSHMYPASDSGSA